MQQSKQVHTTDTQAPPLPLPRVPGTLNGGSDLLVSFVHVINDLLSLHLNVDDCCFLLNDQVVHILEHLCKLDHLALNLLDGSISVLYGGENSTGLASSVALHECL